MPSGSGYYATNYAKDAAFIRTRFQGFCFVILWVIVASLPLVMSSYYLHLVNLALFATLGVLALNLLSGYTGMLSLGQAAFLAIGGFSGVIFGAELKLPFLVVVPIAGLVGALFGLLAGLPALRLRGVYVALSTVALHFIITTAAAKYQSAAHSGSATGFALPKAAIGPLVLETPLEWYVLLIVLTTIFTFFCLNLTRRSRVGRVLVAIRDRETAAAALGVNVGYYKIMIFAFTSAIVSMVGCLNGYYFKYVSYDGYTLFLAVMYLSMTIVGGMGSLFGCYLGAFFLTLLPYALVEIFAVVPVPGSFLRYSFAVQYVLYGLLIMVFLIYEPTGLAGIWGRIRSFFEFWPFRYRKGTNISE